MIPLNLTHAEAKLLRLALSRQIESAIRANQEHGADTETLIAESSQLVTSIQDAIRMGISPRKPVVFIGGGDLKKDRDHVKN